MLVAHQRGFDHLKALPLGERSLEAVEKCGPLSSLLFFHQVKLSENTSRKLIIVR